VVKNNPLLKDSLKNQYYLFVFKDQGFFTTNSVSYLKKIN